MYHNLGEMQPKTNFLLEKPGKRGMLLHSSQPGFSGAIKESETMKKITRIFTLIIALLFTVSAVDASPLSALGRSRLKAEALQSLNNLKQLGTAATMCALDGELPKENGAAGLQKFRENGSITPQLLIAAYDKTSRAAAGSAKIAEENTSYAYLGGAAGSDSRIKGVPLFLEKPQLRPDDQVSVCYADGSVETFQLAERTCAAVVAELQKKSSDSGHPVWNRLKEAAAAIDKSVK